MSIRVINADVLEGLRQIPDESVHCVVTSPPYWGLRDYGVEGQIGLEPTPAEFIAKLVAVFREVRRVLRKDGTCWVNLGDSYANDGKWGGATSGKHAGHLHGGSGIGRGKRDTGLKPKDLVGIPWRFALAMQDDGWWLRQDIIWHKPNPMPESVTDRCTKAHEYIFLLTKAERYYYDAEAIKEEGAGRLDRWPGSGGRLGQQGFTRNTVDEVNGRNKRSVWTIATSPFSEAHFATFPPELPELCIKAGTSEKGCCATCNSPWERRIERETRPNWRGGDKQKHDGTHYRQNPGGGVGNDRRAAIDLGWCTHCSCGAPSVPCTVLDPFGGAGTTGLVADRLQRNAILIELNPEYAAMIQRRLTNDAPLFAEVAT